jgi:60 kDa SS-A/Ro ribonucleoprotein
MNKNLFKSKSVKLTASPTDTKNNAGGVAYSMNDAAALAQLVCTGTYNSTYYTSGEDQLKQVLDLAMKVDTEFLAKLAVYARQNALMKDSPAVLAAVIASRDVDMLSTIFPKVVNDPKMFRNFIKVIRSGVTGRKSFGSRPKKLLQQYLNNLSDEQLFKADVGNDPSLQDCLKMVRPKPANKKRQALYAYLLDKDHNKEDLLPLVNSFEAFKKDMDNDIPDVPFQKLTALPLTDKHWSKIAENATWNQTRMNLNTFARHNVLNDAKMVSAICAKLENPELVRKSKTFPYQLYSAFLNIDAAVPTKISVSLQKATEHALQNIPEFSGKVYVLVDTSGSMNSPITGHRGSATTKMRCIDAASLFASAIMRKNPDTEIIPFDTRVHTHKLNPMDSVATNAKVLSGFGGGGTDCASAIRHLNSKAAKGDLIIMISDNESWFNGGARSWSVAGGTGMENEWLAFKKRNPKSKLVCLDITPNTTTQVSPKPDVLNLGGFSDQLFEVIAKFVENGNDKDHWVNTIKAVEM